VIGGCARRGIPEGPIIWQSDLQQALETARQTDKMVVIDFMADWCPPCRAMDDSTFRHPAVAERFSRVIPVRINVDLHPEIANQYNGNARKYGGIGIPNLLFLSSAGERLVHLVGFQAPDRLTAVLDSLLVR